MWVVSNPDQVPVLIANSPDAKIAQFLRRDHPGAALYVCRQHGAYAQAASHLNATVIVTRDEERQEAQLDDEGAPVLDEHDEPVLIPVSVLVSERIGAGNGLAVDADEPALLLLDPQGAEVGRLPLDPVT